MAQDVLVNAEALTVTVGPIKATAGTLSLDNGNLTTDGSGNITAKNFTGSNASVKQLSGGQSAATTFAAASANTIATSGVRVARVATSGASTSVSNILATGNSPGQEVTVINENTTAGSTLDFAGGSATSNIVGAGTVVSGLSAARFIWDSGTSFWYRTA